MPGQLINEMIGREKMIREKMMNVETRSKRQSSGPERKLLRSRFDLKQLEVL